MYAFSFSIVLPEHNGGTSRIVIISAHLQVAKSFFLKCLLFGLSCGMQDLPCVMHGLSCPEECDILVPSPGIEPTFTTLQGRFLTIGVPKWLNLTWTSVF